MLIITGMPDSQNETQVFPTNDVKTEEKIVKEDKTNKFPPYESDTKDKNVTLSNKKEKEADDKVIF